MIWQSICSGCTEFKLFVFYCTDVISIFFVKMLNDPLTFCLYCWVKLNCARSSVVLLSVRIEWESIYKKKVGKWDFGWLLGHFIRTTNRLQSNVSYLLSYVRYPFLFITNYCDYCTVICSGVICRLVPILNVKEYEYLYFFTINVFASGRPVSA